MTPTSALHPNRRLPRKPRLSAGPALRAPAAINAPLSWRITMTRILSLLSAGTACALIAGMSAALADDIRYESRVLVAGIRPAPHIDSQLVNCCRVPLNLLP